MRRRATVTLVATTVLVLAGCASSAEPSPSQTDAALSGTVTVFAAASLTESFGDIEKQFEEQNPGVDVVLNLGGSSTLAEQIVQGAPADVFAAANPQTMTTVVDASLATEQTIFVTNTLEIVVPADNPGGVTGLADLARPELAIALCAQEVPCGAATEQAFAAAGLSAAADTLEQDVRAVLTKVRLGEVDAGIVYRTDVKAAGTEVVGIPFDEAADVVNEYPIAVLTDAPNPTAAAAFVHFVLSDAARSVFDETGFGVPQ
ncbi:MAG: molybdate ABC transporter substrate-binding protein [Rhodoglobus sp.]